MKLEMTLNETSHNLHLKPIKKNSKGFVFNQQKGFHTMFHFGYNLHNFWSNMFICVKWTFNRSLLPSSFKDYCNQIQLHMAMFSSTLSKDCASWKIAIYVESQVDSWWNCSCGFSLISLLCSNFFNHLLCLIFSQLWCGIQWRKIK